MKSSLQFKTGKIARNLKELISYPIWLTRGRPAPDNHLWKRRRIKRIALASSCSTLIETGTFYGQMISALSNDFELLISVELSETFYKANFQIYSNNPKIRILHGESALRIEQMIKMAKGKILFWLDGHFSGGDTACGKSVSPILQELEQIQKFSTIRHSILIDDIRLFNGRNGYPSIEETTNKILQINKAYRIEFEGDCLIAT